MSFSHLTHSQNETPNIYARLCSNVDSRGNKQSVIVLNDTGVGSSGHANNPGNSSVWNIKTFLDHHLNPEGLLPYLVIISHCHYDHILGLHALLRTRDDNRASYDMDATVLSSSYDPSFISPENLEEHSLCKARGLKAPTYKTAIWASDFQNITYQHPTGLDMNLPIVTIHTPGHTPDSLSWFDTEMRVLYVGDSLYQSESDETRTSPSGKEGAAPVMFTNESNLLDWWRSLYKLICFVHEENTPGKPRVTLACGHVTSSTDAYSCLQRMKAFMARILRDEVPVYAWPPDRGFEVGHWTDDGESPERTYHEFSVVAPVFVVEEGRREIPREEWL